MAAISPRTAAEYGLSRSRLYRSVQSGNFERIARGLYVATDAANADWEWLEAAARRADATICLVSALAHHDLTDVVPDALDVAIPRGARIPATHSAIRWHSFAADTFDLGREEILIPGSSMTIGIYSRERCIADALRLRGDLGYELGRDALREWLRGGGKPADLMAIAGRLPRARKATLETLAAFG
ncbi:transcriptional regulator [Pilimelia anulata]|uniref:Transcriptional regulator n=1 Tax=Pilimelia anulata TaxID=53371 RepID=A0A8J3B2K2_9ACTN|nr:type IV toxin-antitoxin system AbiEi family antitoxin domain-containing protein [Pilimelia anulata]GGJ87454.1 transcriptional regulator [Pilimelia anulata]